MTSLFLQVHLLHAQSYEIFKTLRKNIFLLTFEGTPPGSQECIQGQQDLTGKLHLASISLLSHPFFSRLQKSCLPWQSHGECNIYFEFMMMRKNIRLKVLSQGEGYSVQIQATSWL